VCVCVCGCARWNGANKDERAIFCRPHTDEGAEGAGEGAGQELQGEADVVGGGDGAAAAAAGPEGVEEMLDAGAEPPESEWE